jgi:multidrug resistance efflux pump
MSTAVIFEPASQRLHFRVSSRATVKIGGTSYHTKDWSQGGFSLESYDGTAQPGDRMWIQFSLDFQGFDISFAAVTEVLRRGPKEMAARFGKLDERTTELLSQFVTAIVGGHIVAVQGVLKNIDRPVTKVPLAVPLEQSEKQRANARRFLMTTIYLVLGIFGGGYAFLTIAGLLMRVELDTAVTSIPLEQVVSMDVGTIREFYVQPGREVMSGQSLFRVENEVAVRNVEQESRDVKAAEAALRQAEIETEVEKSKVRIYQSISNDQLQQADARIEAITAERDEARAQFARIKKLWEDQIVSRQVYDVQKALLEKQDALLRQAVAERAVTARSYQTASEGLFFSGNFLVGDLKARTAEQASARDQLKLAREALQQAINHENRRTYYSPFRATVMRVFKSSGVTVDRGEALVVLRRADQDLGVEAFLTQTEAGRIALGAKGVAFIPATGKRYKVEVTTVDRTDGFLKDVQTPKLHEPQWNWRPPEDRSAHAKLAFVGVTARELASIAPGLPVHLSLPKQGTASFSLFPVVHASSLDESTPRLWPRDNPLFGPREAGTDRGSDYKSVRDRVIEAANRALRQPPAPIDVIHSAGETDQHSPESVASHRAFQDADNFVLLAIAYKLTGTASYRDSAQAIVAAWAHVNKPSGNPIDETRLGPFLWGLDLLGIGSQSLDVRRWLERWAEAARSWKPGAVAETNNHQTHHLKTLLALDRLLGMTIQYQRDLAHAERHAEVNLASLDGASLDYEQRDALHYHVYDLEAWIEIALLTNCCEGRIDRSFAFFERTIREHPDHIEFANSSAPIDRKRAAAGFEYAKPHTYDVRKAAQAIFEYATLPGRRVSPELWTAALNGRRRDNLFYEARYYLWQPRR